MILPLPVKKNKFGQRVADISVETYYYNQITEEVLEAYQAAVIFEYECENEILSGTIIESYEPEKLVDIITCCITRLEILGYNDEKRQKLYQAVNEKNRKRGYFDD